MNGPEGPARVWGARELSPAEREKGLGVVPEEERKVPSRNN